MQCCDDRHRRPRTLEADNAAVGISLNVDEAEGLEADDSIVNLSKNDAETGAPSLPAFGFVA